MPKIFSEKKIFNRRSFGRTAWTLTGCGSHTLGPARALGCAPAARPDVPRAFRGGAGRARVAFRAAPGPEQLAVLKLAHCSERWGTVHAGGGAGGDG